MILNKEKAGAYLKKTGVIVFAVAVILVINIYYNIKYNERVADNFEKMADDFQTIRESLHLQKTNVLNEDINKSIVKSEQYVKNLNSFIDSQNIIIIEDVKNKLKNNVYVASESANYIYNKYGKNKKKIINMSKSLLSINKKESIFITDYYGNSVLLGDQKIDKKNITSFLDADARSIILEEVQKVRKRGEGFLQSYFYNSNEKYIIFVKDMKMYKLFAGSMTNLTREQAKLKSVLIDHINMTPRQNYEFINIYDNKKLIYSSLDITQDNNTVLIKDVDENLSAKSGWYKSKQDNYSYFCDYNKAFDWHIVYGFNEDILKKEEFKKYKSFENILDLKNYY